MTGDKLLWKRQRNSSYILYQEITLQDEKIFVYQEGYCFTELANY